MTTPPQISQPTIGDRIKMAAAWFVVGGVVLAAVTAIPAGIIGFEEIQYKQLVSWSALIVGIGGAIYGHYPPPFSN